MRLGALPAEGGVEFRVWAPLCRTVDVLIVDGPGSSALFHMRREGDIFEAFVAGAGTDSEYFYVLDGARERPDPVSRRQLRGVHGPSCVVELGAFRWSDVAW